MSDFLLIRMQAQSHNFFAQKAVSRRANHPPFLSCPLTKQKPKALEDLSSQASDSEARCESDEKERKKTLQEICEELFNDEPGGEATIANPKWLDQALSDFVRLLNEKISSSTYRSMEDEFHLAMVTAIRLHTTLAETGCHEFPAISY